MNAGLRWRWRQERVEEAPEVYRERIESLAEILHGLPWVLGGGLAIPFTRGEFHRPHIDIDLLFEHDVFPDVEAAFARAGYDLWQHYTMSLFGAFTGAWHVRVRHDHPLVRLRTRKLKFRDRTGSRPPLLATVDALPYRIADGRLCTCDRRHCYPITRPLVGHRVRTAAGFEIPCLDFEYVALLKGRRRDHKDLVDFALIRDAGLLPEGDWGV